MTTFSYFYIMVIEFCKFQGAGNDFVLIDNRDGRYNALSKDKIKFLCDRNFGIGSDGLIQLKLHPNVDFEMDFFNPDGSKSFCGNGARCTVAYAQALSVNFSTYTFAAIDGYHDFTIDDSMIGIHMQDVATIEKLKSDEVFINTGSPHYVLLDNDLSTPHVIEKGKEIRHSEAYNEQGVNVNLVQEQSSDTIRIATFERGVENETLACGTGATACALFFADRNQLTQGKINVLAKGGSLTVSFERRNSAFTNVWLNGSAQFVYKGTIELI